MLMAPIFKLFGQGHHQVVQDGTICDSLTWTSTDYPVRLTNEISELQKTIAEQLVLYPEDLDKTAEFTFRLTVTCTGIMTSSALEAQKGNSQGLSKRILKILDTNCTFSPAIKDDQPVNSFYHLGIKFKKGKIEVVPQGDHS